MGKKKGVEPVHTVSDLRQMQSLSLESKIRMSTYRINEWYNYWGGDVYVSFSGGKDSTVLLDLVRKVLGDWVPAVYIDTGLEYKSVRNHTMSADNLTVLHPMEWDKSTRKWVRTNFKKVISEHGYPVVSKEISKVIAEARKGIRQGEGKYQNSIQKLNGEFKDRDGKRSKYNCPKWKFLLDAPFEVSNKCCNIMKKNPAHLYERETGRHAFIGTLADESALRLNTWLYQGCNAFNNEHPVSNPLSFWTEDDILAYLIVNDLKYADVYGNIIGKCENLTFTASQVRKIVENAPQTWRERVSLSTTGLDRTGCVFCGFGAHLDPEPNRYQKLKEIEPKKYEYCFKSCSEGGLGFNDVMDYMGVNYK